MDTTTTSFPNGFESWHETHYEICSAITKESMSDSPQGVVASVIESQGTGGLYELAKDLADKFEKKYEGVMWDGEYFDEMEKFIEQELYQRSAPTT